jgi:CIC family chloride channel protein
MLFEMTGDYKIILPLMITCIISALVAGQLYRESIYTLKLTRRGVDIQAGREVNVLKSISVRDVMNVDVETIYEGAPLGVFSRIIAKSKYNSFPVLDADDQLVSILSFADYRDAVFNEDLKDLIIARDLATKAVHTIDTDANLYDALQAISYKDFAILPVVSADDAQHLVGVVSRRDILGAYDKAVLKNSLFPRS